MKRAGNRANPDLVMKFAQNSGENIDWWLDSFSLEELRHVPVRFWDEPNAKFKAEALKGDAEINGYHFWYGTLWFPYKGGWLTGHPNENEVVLANQDRAIEAGARAFYGIEADQLVKENGRVVAVIGHDWQGNYYRYNAKKGVVLATAGFEGNKEMLEELVVDAKDLFTDDECYEDLKLKPQNGHGIRMGVWAGGRMETRPIATAGGNRFLMRGINEAFGTLWLNAEGKRFCNEVFGGSELAGFAGNQMARGTCYNIFDEHVLEYLQWSPPMHYGFDFSERADVERLLNLIDYAKSHTDGRCEVNNKPKLNNAAPIGADRLTSRSPLKQIVYYGRTPEELVGNAGLEGALAANIVASIKRYNQIAANGRDEDYGKDARILMPLSGMLFMEGRVPVYGGNRFFTCGALVTNADLNVLDESYHPIPGLYASGNCCGRRFGLQYSTPITGLSLGMSIVLGREAGAAVARSK